MWWRQRGFFSLSFLALPPWILAAEPFDWAMRRRGHQADHSARSSERINARWNKFIIDADSEAFAGMSEHEAKGFWTSGAGHGATAEQINKHDDREKYDKWVIRALLWRWKVLTWSFSKLGEIGVFLLFCMCCKQVSQLFGESNGLYDINYKKKTTFSRNSFLKKAFFWLLSFRRKKSRCTWRRTPPASSPSTLT